MKKIMLAVVAVVLSFVVCSAAVAGIEDDHAKWLSKVMARELKAAQATAEKGISVTAGQSGPYVTFRYVDKDGTLLATDFLTLKGRELTIVSKIVYKYVAGHRLNGSVYRDYDGTGVADTRIDYEYDSDGVNLLSRSQYKFVSMEGREINYRLVQINSYALFGSERKLSKCVNYYDDGVTIKNITYYSYDSEGRISTRQEEVYDSDGVKYTGYTFIYFGEVRKILSRVVRTFSADNQTLSIYIENREYHENGAVKMKYIHYIDCADPTKSFNKICVYDESGNLISESAPAPADMLRLASDVLNDDLAYGLVVSPGQDIASGAIVTYFYDENNARIGKHEIRALDPIVPGAGSWYKWDASTGDYVLVAVGASQEEMTKATEILGANVGIGITFLPDPSAEGPLVTITKFYDINGNFIGQHVFTSPMDENPRDEWYCVDSFTGDLVMVARAANAEELQQALEILGEAVYNGMVIFPPAHSTGNPTVTKFYDVNGNLIGTHSVNESLAPDNPDRDMWFDANGNPIDIDKHIKPKSKVSDQPLSSEEMLPQGPSTAAGTELLDRLIIAQAIQEGKASLPEGVTIASPKDPLKAKEALKAQ